MIRFKVVCVRYSLSTDATLLATEGYTNGGISVSRFPTFSVKRFGQKVSLMAVTSRTLP